MYTTGPKNSFPGVPNGSDAEEIRAHTNRVLASTAFRSSKRCYRFLDFIVTQVLEGKAATIKERTLATEVFDRSASWDPGSEDTIVRVGAREVRKRLAQFYSSPEATKEKLRIELPLGSYVPEFIRTDADVHAAPAPVPVTAPPPPVRPSRSWAKYAAIGVVVAALAALVIFAASRFWTRHTNDAFEAFWDPFFHSSEPVLLAVASPVVYSPSGKVWREDHSKFGPVLPLRSLQLPLDQLKGSDFLPAQDQFVAFGDAAAAADVKSLLAVHSRESRIRFASKLVFGDFRDAPSVMIGGFTNRWTIELTQRLRYHFGYTSNWVPAILDSTDPKRSWSIAKQSENGSSAEDYVLIIRLKNSPTGTPIMIGAGLAQFGTEAAGRFLRDQPVMNEILKKVPPGWANRNLQLILHARVIQDSPANPELVASYVW